MTIFAQQGDQGRSKEAVADGQLPVRQAVMDDVACEGAPLGQGVGIRRSHKQSDRRRTPLPINTADLRASSMSIAIPTSIS